jgi:hypothetical protein
MTDDEFKKLIKTKTDGRLFKRENTTLEFKLNFSQGSISDYAKTFCAFANNSGGVMVFGIGDNPRLPTGMTNDRFSQLEVEKVTNFLNQHYAPTIEWEPFEFEIEGKKFGVIKIQGSNNKPVVCKTNTPHDVAREGDIFYRYSGRSERIKYPELRSILDETRAAEQRKWVEHIQNIARIGPQNIAIVDTLRGEIEGKGNQKLLIDTKLLKDIKFVQEGKFVDKDGAPTLKLVGTITPIEKVEVEVIKNADKLKIYTLTATDLYNAVKAECPAIRQTKEYYKIIADHKIKDKKELSDFVFRSNKQQEQYEKFGILQKGITSVYKPEAVDFIVEIYKKDYLL